MQVAYSFHGTAFSFDVAEPEDLSALASEIRQHLTASHPDLSSQEHLSVTIADGILDSLAEDAQAIALGELAHD